MTRASARIDLGAVQRNCARLKQEVGEGVELCAVVKADGYGHGAGACADAALAGGATRLAVATAVEAKQIGHGLPHVPLLTMGALTPDDLDMVLATGSEISVWREGFLGLVADRARAWGRPAKVHVKHDSGMGRLGNRDPAAVIGIARACAASDDLELAGVWTHFATADEPDSGLLRRPARAVRRRRRDGPDRVPRGDDPRRQQRRRPPRPPLPFRHGPLRGRDLRPRPLPGRPRRARPLAGALALLLRRRRQAASPPATAPATGRPGGRRPTPTSASCRSGTATASAVASPTTPRSWSGAGATRSSAPSRWTT